MNKADENRTKRKNKNTHDGFIGGILVLTVSNLLVKIIGLSFKIPMNRIVGDTGMGYYNSAYSIYTLFYMLSTSGLPVATSVMVSENRAKGRISSAKKVFRLALIVFALIGAFGSGLMLLFADNLAEFIGSELSAVSVATASVTILFVCISGAYRGYFQGCGNMTPTAVSQLTEALGKLTVGVLCALYATKMGYAIHITAAYAVFGLTAGSFLGMLYLILTGFVRRDRDLISNTEIDYTAAKTSDILKRFVKISFPITLSASVMSLTNTLDTAMIQRLLVEGGMDGEKAAALYGNYTSLAVPMFNLPPVLVYPIAYSLVPVVASAASNVGKVRDKILSSLKYAFIIGLPCSMGLAVLSEPILCLLYKEQSAHMAAYLLTLLAPSSLLVCILAVTNSVLQGCGKEKMPLVSMLVGGMVKLVLGYALIKRYGIYGAPLSTFACYMAATTLNLVFVLRCADIRLKFGMLYKVLASSVLCAVTAEMGYKLLTLFSVNTDLSCVLAVALAAFVYASILLMLGEIKLSDIRKIIKSKKQGV